MTALDHPLGVTPCGDGVSVAVHSADATRIELCLFDDLGHREIARIPLERRTGDIWHDHIAGVLPGARYGLRAHGAYDPPRGLRFNPAKLLVDPYAWQIDRSFTLDRTMFGFRRAGGPDQVDSAAATPKGVVFLAGDAPAAHVQVPWRDTILYELNIRAFTRLHPDVPDVMRGTFAGFARPEPISHLKSLGISTVELMPAMAFIDERHLAGLGLSNAWGYNPIAFGVPDPRLAPGGWQEVRDSLAVLHAAGLEVILDVVLNHTGESDELGPTLSMRGLDNAGWYRLDPADPARYINDAGCGNCLALDRPHVVAFAMEMLRRWARAGIDGFRFDLATALGRRADGFDPAAPLLAAIGQDPELGVLKMIAEPWDIGPGGYQLGHFPAPWGEWNDRYRDTTRRFWRGEAGLRGDMATRLAGSADVFAARNRPGRSINFVTAHDGFTLADLVAYEAKHNHANGEDNRDGGNDNHSWNHGVEGPSDDPAIVRARLADQKALLATLLLGRGTPMLQMGAEFGHSQGGNNNAYAQDNATTWLDWSEASPELAGTIAALTSLRRACPLLSADTFLTGHEQGGLRDAVWLRPDGHEMSPADWDDPGARTLLLRLADSQSTLLVALNAGHDDAVLTLEGGAAAWQRLHSTRPEFTEDVLPARAVALYARKQPRPGAAASPGTLARLAAETGIAAGWWSHGGTYQPTSDDTRRALLSAMGLDVSTESTARDSLAGLRHSRAIGLARHGHGAENEKLHLAYGAATPARPPPDLFELVSEDGTARSIRAETTPYVSTDGIWRSALALPPLPAGRYRLHATDGAVTTLTVAPRKCHLPRRRRRSIGLSCQLYALSRQDDQGIGDFTTLAETAVAAARHGMSTLGINPLHALFAGDAERASPYHPSDRRFLEPLMIDVAGLDGLPHSPLSATLLRASAAEFAALRARPLIDYRAVAGLKTTILRACHEAFRTAGGQAATLQGELDAFIAAGGRDLQRFGVFRALERHYEGRAWQQWGAHADPDSAAVDAFAAAMPRDIDYELFLQWLAERQLAEAAARGRDAGLRIGLYRDLAVGCAPDGAERWADRAGFANDVSVGAPPDPFSASGQNWCLPPPNPLTMADGGFARFRALLTANMRHAGMMRIDHVMALTRLFWVPDGAATAEGAYVSYPLDALLAELALESRRAECIVVGEDLGTVPEGFRPALEDKGLLTYRVLWFERQNDGGGQQEGFTDPRLYPELAVACASTHDLPPLAGWWAGTDIAEDVALGRMTADQAEAAIATRERERTALANAADQSEASAPLPAEMTPELAAAVHAMVATAPSLVAFAQADDLGGETVAINLPGTDRERPNWRRRLATPVPDLFDTPVAAAILAAMRAERN